MPGRFAEVVVTPAGMPMVRIGRERMDAASAWELRQALLRAIYSSGPSLWVDLAGVRYIDSAGLGVLLTAQTEARRRQGEILLVNPGHEVLRVLRQSGLDTLFQIRQIGVATPPAAGNLPAASQPLAA